jgi:hypothetical protein
LKKAKCPANPRVSPIRKTKLKSLPIKLSSSIDGTAPIVTTPKVLGEPETRLVSRLNLFEGRKRGNIFGRFFSSRQ